MLNKLRTKFILINMCIVLTMLLIIFATIFHFTRADLQGQADSMMRTLTQSVRKPSGFRDPGKDVRLPYFVIQIYLNGDIHVVGRTYHDLNDKAFLEELIQHVFGSGRSEDVIKKYDLRYRVENNLGTQKLIFLDVSSQNSALEALIQTSILIGIGSLVIFLVISILLAHWAVKPVAKAWEQQQQFVSDASHELKTPLTVIMCNAELLQNPDNDSQSQAQFTDNILIMSHRMRTLVEGLLDLARADNGHIQQSYEKLDLSRLTEDALLPFEPVLFENQLTLDCSIEPDIFLNGSAIHLQQLISILLDNAAKYASPGVVSVNLSKRGRNSCLLTVSNPGKPIAETDLTKIFDRFYRADTARTGNGSFGLGLSIAKSIAENHRGKIWAKSNQTGNCFYVLLPII